MVNGVGSGQSNCKSMQNKNVNQSHSSRLPTLYWLYSSCRVVSSCLELSRSDCRALCLFSIDLIILCCESWADLSLSSAEILCEDNSDISTCSCQRDNNINSLQHSNEAIFGDEIKCSHCHQLKKVATAYGSGLLIAYKQVPADLRSS